VRIDTMIGEGAGGDHIELLAEQVRQAAALGLDGAWASEVKHDPFLCCLIAAQQSKNMTIGTAIAVAFARSPMTVASTAFDLQTLSRGRFALGLGTQIKPHIERRFNMPWSSPTARIKEYVQALHAIWDSWETGDRLDFVGDFYQHTLMTPMFSPGANQFGKPKVFIAAVGERMCRAAAEVADGLLVHSFTTARYLQEVTVPLVEQGLQARGVSRQAFELQYPAFIATGANEEELDTSVRAVRARIAFYGSTPAYSPVLALHGWGALHVELNSLSKRGEWEQMADLIDDEVLTTFAACGSAEEVGRQIVKRFAGLVDRISLFSPGELSPALQASIVSEIRERA
jgi:probable F420-dependent oxidoreductase